MKRIPEPLLSLAIVLAAVAGFVDVIAFLAIGGFFASFMSGNTTRLAIGIGGNPADAAVAAMLIGSFVSGVTGATLLGRRLATHRAAGILALVTALLLLCVLIARPYQTMPLLLLAGAMGSMNTIYVRGGEVSIGLTYMTGTLVRIGQNLAHWIARDGEHHDWLRPLLLWGGFLGGGMAGVGLFWRLGIPALWVPIAVTGSLAAVLWYMGRHHGLSDTAAGLVAEE